MKKLLLVVLFMPLILAAQCEILKLSGYDLGTDWVPLALSQSDSLSTSKGNLLGPIVTTSAKIELRITQYTKYPGVMVLRIFCNEDKWRAEKYDFPTNNRKFLENEKKQFQKNWSKVKYENRGNSLSYHQLKSAHKTELFWDSLWTKLLNRGLFTIASSSEVHERILDDAIEKFGDIDSIPLTDRSNLAFLGAISFKVELKIYDKYRSIDYYAPGGYAKHFPEIEEFSEFLDIIKTIYKRFHILY